METYCFIGSDKSGGKTTAFNSIYDKMYREAAEPSVCVTGIGINGENVDSYDGAVKPSIRLRPGSYFLTHTRHLQKHGGKYQTHRVLGEPEYHGHYVFGRCLAGFEIILEGPNSGHQLLAGKKIIAETLPGGTMLIDGSIDRQFLADPAISDMFYFSLLFSGREPQRQKVGNMLRALRLQPGPPGICEIADRLIRETTRSLLFAPNGELYYHGTEMPFTDEGLRAVIESLGNTPAWLYLGGALTPFFARFLGPHMNLSLLLDNFTLYQSPPSDRPGRERFRPSVALFHPVRIKAIFVKEEVPFDRSLLPEGVPVINLFRLGEGA